MVDAYSIEPYKDNSEMSYQEYLAKYQPITGEIAPAGFQVFYDRVLAIKTAIENSEPNDIILIAGKGHEEEQIYSNKIIKISDKKIIKKIKVKKKSWTYKHLNFSQNKLFFQVTATFSNIDVENLKFSMSLGFVPLVNVQQLQFILMLSTTIMVSLVK